MRTKKTPKWYKIALRYVPLSRKHHHPKMEISKSASFWESLDVFHHRLQKAGCKNHNLRLRRRFHQPESASSHKKRETDRFHGMFVAGISEIPSARWVLPKSCCRKIQFQSRTVRDDRDENSTSGRKCTLRHENTQKGHDGDKKYPEIVARTGSVFVFDHKDRLQQATPPRSPCKSDRLPRWR